MKLLKLKENEMRKIFASFILPLLLGNTFLYSNTLSEVLDSTETPSKIQLSEEEMNMPLFNNRILTRVNGDPISLYDVIKKMDFVFYQQFPQYATSTPARLQFYQTQWRSFLDNVVEEKLLIADAKEKHLSIRDGEVREELERMFGPKVIENIDLAGLTFADAWEMVRNHLTVQRMSYIAVHMKANQQVSPETVRRHYYDNINQYSKPSELEYQLISIKSTDELECSYLANIALEKIINEKQVDANLKKEIEEKASFAEVSISGPYQRKEQDISDGHLIELKKLQPGECSEPTSFVKDESKKEYYKRIFYLQNIVPSEKMPIEKVETIISDTLLQTAINDLSDKYLNELKKRFGVDKAELKESIPDDYQPFSV